MIGALTHQQESLAQVYDEILPILKEHYLEIAHYKDIKFEPDIAEYYRFEASGNLKIYTVRDDGELIGYAIYIIKKNLHYKSSLTAGQDVLFIRKDKRGFGREFIKWCDEELKKLGVQVVYQHIKFSHDWSKMLERMGYEKQDMILSKRLDRKG